MDITICEWETSSAKRLTPDERHLLRQEGLTDIKGWLKTHKDPESITVRHVRTGEVRTIRR